MIVTVEDAKKIECPLKQFITIIGSIMLVSKLETIPKITEEVMKNKISEIMSAKYCVGSSCMLWCWDRNLNDVKLKGHCGLLNIHKESLQPGCLS